MNDRPASAWPWPAPTDDGGARHLVAGLAMPDMRLPATPGGTVNLARRDGASVVFVYPWTGRAGLPDPPDWDHIPGAHGSTPEAEGFRDAYRGFKAQDCEVFGLSGQDEEHHGELSRRLRLPFALLSDAGLAFARALRLPAFETGGVAYLRRLTLVVRDGRLVHAIYPVHPPDRHAAEVLAGLQERDDAALSSAPRGTTGTSRSR